MQHWVKDKKKCSNGGLQPSPRNLIAKIKKRQSVLDKPELGDFVEFASMHRRLG